MHGDPIGHIPEYHVSLGKKAERRWNEIIEYHHEDAVELMDNALDNFEDGLGNIWTPAAIFIKNLLATGFKLSGGYFQDDIQALADDLGMSASDIIVANISYELSQAGELLAPPSGCTAVVLKVPRVGLVHVRNLDWPLKGMGRTTIIIRFKKRGREIVAVTNPGLVGVLSGMVPKRFSVTLNWAPPNQRPRFKLGPIFLIRWVLENARNYKEAVDYLCNTELAAQCFFMVVGNEDEACVIERTIDDYALREYDSSPLVLTNHYVTDKFEHLNHDEIESSVSRYRSALRAARRYSKQNLKDTLKILGTRTTLHEQTVQQMAFAPKSGKFIARAFDNDDLI